MPSTAKKNALIVYCHPYAGSFNHAVLEAAESGFNAADKPWELIDLEADGFDPTLHAADLKLYNEGGYTDPLVGRYQAMIERADRLVMIAPIWWNDIPAQLKGWIDKVMLLGFCWENSPTGLYGTLDKYIKRVDVLTTSDGPTTNFDVAIETGLMDGTFKQLRVTEYRWHNFELLGASTPDSRRAWLEGVGGLLGL